jgi:hypothetical protein
MSNRENRTDAVTEVDRLRTEVADLRDKQRDAAIEQLRAELKEFKADQEEVLAKRVFDKTKQRLNTYLTAGGVVVLVSSVFAVLQLTSSIKEHAQKTIKDVAENESKKALDDQAKAAIKHIQDRDSTMKLEMDAAMKKIRDDYDALGRAKQAELEKLAQDQVARLNSVNVPTAGVTPTQTTGPSPAAVDYTAEMGPVRDQGQENSSVGFAVAAALEYQVWKISKKRVTISPRYIYYEARLKLGTGKLADSGAVLRDAIEVVATRGAVAEDVWPFRQGEVNAKPPMKVEVAERYRITRYQLLRNVPELKAALLRTGPVVGGFLAYGETFGGDNSGLAAMPKPGEVSFGSHAVCFVGFDDRTQRLKFKNSWTAKWGENGYGYLPYEYANRFLSEAWEIMVADPKDGPKDGAAVPPLAAKDAAGPPAEKLTIVVVEDTSKPFVGRSGVLDALRRRATDRGDVVSVIDKDIKDQTGHVPEKFRHPLQEASGKPLPHVVVCDSKGKAIFTGALPTDPAEAVKLIDKYAVK